MDQVSVGAADASGWRSTKNRTRSRNAPAAGPTRRGRRRSTSAMIAAVPADPERPAPQPGDVRRRGRRRTRPDRPYPRGGVRPPRTPPRRRGRAAAVLEIGPGTGQATIPLLDLGLPGHRGRARARTSAPGWPSAPSGRPVDIVTSSFEDADLPERRVRPGAVGDVVPLGRSRRRHPEGVRPAATGWLVRARLERLRRSRRGRTRSTRRSRRCSQRVEPERRPPTCPA